MRLNKLHVLPYFLIFSVALIGCSSAEKLSLPAQSGALNESHSTGGATPVAANTSPDKSAKESERRLLGIACTRDNDTRLVEIEILTPKGCKLWYSRLGVKNTIASSVNGDGQCVKVRDQIRGNLEKSKYNCSDYQTAESRKRK